MPDDIFTALLGREVRPEDRPLLEKLVELMKPRPMNPEEPPIPPPNFRPATISTPDMSRDLEQLLQVQPELRGRVPSVIEGPSHVSRLAAKERGGNFGPEEFGPLLGAYFKKSGEIALNPEWSHWRKETLAHELTHAAGWGEARAYKVSDVMRELLLSDVVRSAAARDKARKARLPLPDGGYRED